MDGTPFGRYRLVELLGRGGMGEVWRAYDAETKRTVAIKVLPHQLADDSDFVRRFQREAEAAAQLNSPHVIPIHHYGEINGRLYVDMRLVEGRDLHAVLTEGPLDLARAVHIVSQVAKALHAAHKTGLLHRDIKPSNILLDDDDFAYLIDFGIARTLDDTRMTKDGTAVGTYNYIAPERLTVGTDEDARVDIYSLACVLYECMTGHPPFPAHTMQQLIGAHLYAEPPRPSKTRPDVPAAVDDIIATGMAKDPNLRYATTIELADAARDAITGPEPTLPSDPLAAQHELDPLPARQTVLGSQQLPADPGLLGSAVTEHADQVTQRRPQLQPSGSESRASRRAVTTQPPASPGRRVGAGFIDAIPILIAYGLAAARALGEERSLCRYVNGVLAPINYSTIPIHQCVFFYSAPAAWTALIVASLVVMVYSIGNWGYLQGKTGSSIGKSVFRFKVLDQQTGRPLGVGANRIGKVAAVTVAILLLGIGLFAVAVVPLLNFGPKGPL